MSAFAQELLTVERERLDLRAGLLGLVVLAVFGVAIALVGPVGDGSRDRRAGGALDRSAAGRSLLGDGRSCRSSSAAPSLTFIAVSIGDQAVPAALLVGVVGVVATLLTGRSRKAGTRGLVATLWIILALTLGHTGVGALDYAVAFAVGAAVGRGRGLVPGSSRVR